MTKHSHHKTETVKEIAPEVSAAAVSEVAPEVVETPPSPQAEEPKASAEQVPEQFITGLNAITGTDTRELPRVFEVEYPGCLIGKQVFVATDGEAACKAYRESCGMTSNSRPPVVSELPSDSAGYRAALEVEAAKAEAAKK